MNSSWRHHSTAALHHRPPYVPSLREFFEAGGRDYQEYRAYTNNILQAWMNVSNSTVVGCSSLDHATRSSNVPGFITSREILLAPAAATAHQYILANAGRFELDNRRICSPPSSVALIISPLPGDPPTKHHPNHLSIDLLRQPPHHHVTTPASNGDIPNSSTCGMGGASNLKNPDNRDSQDPPKRSGMIPRKDDRDELRPVRDQASPPSFHKTECEGEQEQSCSGDILDLSASRKRKSSSIYAERSDKMPRASSDGARTPEVDRSLPIKLPERIPATEDTSVSSPSTTEGGGINNNNNISSSNIANSSAISGGSSASTVCSSNSLPRASVLPNVVSAPIQPSVAPDINSWTTDEVVRFVSNIPGCREYAKTFREQEIDGACLLHLSDDHLLNVCRMKLGPSIRLKLAINAIGQRPDSSVYQSNFGTDLASRLMPV